MLTSGSDNKNLLSVKYNWNKAKMTCSQIIENTQWLHAQAKLTVIVMSSEQKYVHLSNGLIHIHEIHYTFKVWNHRGFIHWECHTCPLFIWWWFAIMFHHFSKQSQCCIFGIWIHSVMQLDNRERAYKALSHCLTYTFTGLHEMYHPRQWPFHSVISYSGENKVLYRKIFVCLSQEQLGYSTKLIIH